MRKINIRQKDPEHYAQVKAAQEKLARKYPPGSMVLDRPCPYCGYVVSTSIQGGNNNGYLWETCPRCEEKVLFPPLKYRMAR